MERTGKIVCAVVLVAIIVGVVVYESEFGYGSVTIKVTDPPESWGPASNIQVQYSGITIHRAGHNNESGWFTVVNQSGWLDLSAVINVTKTLGHTSLRAGIYNVIRLEVLDAIVTVQGQDYTATVESGKLNIPITRGGIRVIAHAATSVTIDINPTVTGSAATGFKLTPAARAI